MSARRVWEQRLRAEATQGDSVSTCVVASVTVTPATVASAKDRAAGIRTPQPTTGDRAVVAACALLETFGS